MRLGLFNRRINKIRGMSGKVAKGSIKKVAQTAPFGAPELRPKAAVRGVYQAI